MATVVNLPRDTRFGELGDALAEGVDALVKERRDKQARKAIESTLDAVAQAGDFNEAMSAVNRLRTERGMHTQERQALIAALEDNVAAQFGDTAPITSTQRFTEEEKFRRQTAEPQTEAAKAQLDLRAGRIDQDAFDIIMGNLESDVNVEVVPDDSSSTGFRRRTRADSVGEEAPPPRTGINITTGDDEVAKKDAERLFALEDNAISAATRKANLETMKAVVDSETFKTGSAGEVRRDLSRVAELLGLDPNRIPLLGSAATADAFESAANQIAVSLAQDLPRVTVMGLTFIQESLPQLIKTEEGNRLIIEMGKRIADREIWLAGMANDLYSQYGTLRPPNAKSYWQRWREEDERNPLFSEKMQERIKEQANKAPEDFSWFNPEKERTEIDGIPVISTPEEIEALDVGDVVMWRHPDGSLERMKKQ